MAYHFIGIKGTGMAALACILADEKYEVNGSDIDKYIFTQDGLEERGIPFTSFDAKNIKNGDTVIIGAAFDRSNPEVAQALDNPNVKAYWYFDFLGEFAKNYKSISIAGTHGKSTTTGIMGTLLPKLAKSGYLIGDGHGNMPEGSEYFVFESCEFQRHFLCYHPDYAILTNIELDHVDYYKDIDDYVSAFQEFADQVGKKIVYFGDDPYLPKLDYKVPAISYGLKDGNDYQAIHIEQGSFGMHFDILHDGKEIAHVELKEASDTFLQDALGSFALAYELGMNVEDIIEGLQSFKGVARRSVIEEVGDSVLVDDYAHHPTAIRYLIDAARKRFPNKKVVALYKPDRYSRLQYFLDGFAESLNTADEVVLCDFPKNAVREDETITVTIDDLLNKCKNAQLLDIDDASAKVLYDMKPAVYLFMSSKDIYLLKDKLKKLMEA